MYGSVIIEREGDDARNVSRQRQSHRFRAGHLAGFDGAAPDHLERSALDAVRPGRISAVRMNL